ncbi:hypothetical protein PIB30_067754 [Stylosanthes scabra]|uniref:Uncharacterized protein n=1 Tax=Stylosanthes scabra TaxID=79078 RepID=A0ABU6RN35_9FABA|nr:hypothetical protein [Stylosanthes scabra]
MGSGTFLPAAVLLAHGDNGTMQTRYHHHRHPPQPAADPSFPATMSGDNDQKLRQKDLEEYYKAGTELENESRQGITGSVNSGDGKGVPSVSSVEFSGGDALILAAQSFR